MPTTISPAERFRALHHGPGFVMPNAWDGVSVRLIAEAGFPATATSSAALAFALGRRDGEVSLAEHFAHAELLARIGGLPVNGDFEDGYGETADDVAATCRAAIDAGLAGVGIEDTSRDPDHPIRDYDDALARVRAMVAAAGGRIVVTARCDNFLHDRPDLDDTVRRLVAFAEAGADVLYAPGLPDMAAIRTVVAAVAPRPVNVLTGPGDGAVTVDELFAAGVRRISLGSALYLHSAGAARDALAAIGRGEVTRVRDHALSYGEATALVS